MSGRSLCWLSPTHGPVSFPQASSEKPKRPISAMFIFSEEKRKQLQEERPELSESELTRLLARMWNDLSEKKKVGIPRLISSIPVFAAPLGISGSLGDAPCLCPVARGFACPRAPQLGNDCPQEHHSSSEPSPRRWCRHQWVPPAVLSPSRDLVGQNPAA